MLIIYCIEETHLQAYIYMHWINVHQQIVKSNITVKYLGPVAMLILNLIQFKLNLALSTYLVK